MVPYYLITSTDFNVRKINTLVSISQYGIDSVTDNTPLSSIKKNSRKSITGFNCYDLTTETLKHQKGRAYGKPDVFQNFILVKDG